MNMRIATIATALAMLAIPSSAQAIELAQPGIHIPDTYGDSGGYTTRGDEFVRWQPLDHTDPGGVPHTVQVEEFFSPRGQRVSLVWYDGQPKTGGLSNLAAWGVGHRGRLSTTPDHCAITEADDEIWKIQDTSNLPCARAKRALDHFLERDHAPRHFRCLLVDETRAKCWRKGHRTTQFAYAVETDQDALALQRSHRAHEVAYCGESSPGAYRIFAPAGQEETCDAFAFAAGRLAAARFIYGTWSIDVEGWICASADQGVACRKGGQCARVVKGSFDADTDSDGRGEFWWAPAAAC